MDTKVDNLADDDARDLAQVTLLIENPRKRNNLGPILRCCTAFGISQIFVIGVDKCNGQGSHGASKHVELLAYPTCNAALEALHGLGFMLYGVLQGVSNGYEEQTLVKNSVPNNQDDEVEERVEVIGLSSNEASTARAATLSADGGNEAKKSKFLPKSIPVHHRPFSHRMCLVLEKKPKGLSWHLAKHCEHFVHVPHQGFVTNNDEDCTIGRSWLSIEASLSIILHEFTAWAGYNKASYGKNHGQKYDVQRISKGSTTAEAAEKKREERRQRREAKEKEASTSMADPSSQRLDATKDDGDD